MGNGETTYRDAHTFCLGFPSYREDLYGEVDALLKSIQSGDVRFKGRPSRNSVIKSLVVCALAERGVTRAEEEMEQSGLAELCDMVKGGTFGQARATR